MRPLSFSELHISHLWMIPTQQVPQTAVIMMHHQYHHHLNHSHHHHRHLHVIVTAAAMSNITFVTIALSPPSSPTPSIPREDQSHKPKCPMDVFASMPIKVAKGHTLNSRRTGWAVPSREGREPAAQESGAPLPPSQCSVVQAGPSPRAWLTTLPCRLRHTLATWPWQVNNV